MDKQSNLNEDEQLENNLEKTFGNSRLNDFKQTLNEVSDAYEEPSSNNQTIVYVIIFILITMAILFLTKTI